MRPNPGVTPPSTGAATPQALFRTSSSPSAAPVAGFGRIVASETETPNLLVNLV